MAKKTPKKLKKGSVKTQKVTKKPKVKETNKKKKEVSKPVEIISSIGRYMNK